MTSCHTESILVLWRYESSYGKDGTTKIRKCKKENLEHSGWRMLCMNVSALMPNNIN